LIERAVHFPHAALPNQLSDFKTTCDQLLYIHKWLPIRSPNDKYAVPIV